MRTLLMAQRPRYILSLGDSMSIDAYAGGPGRGAASLLYQNRDADFPSWAGRDLKSRLPGARLIPLAMDGGTSGNSRGTRSPAFAARSGRPPSESPRPSTRSLRTMRASSSSKTSCAV